MAWSGKVLGYLRGLGDGDLEAEGLDLADVVTDLPVGVEAGLVVAVAEVGVTGGGIGEQVPDDECDTRSHMLRVNLADWRASMT